MYDNVEEREKAKRVFHQIKSKYEKGNFQGAIRQLEIEKDLLGSFLDIGSQLNLNKMYANSAFALMRKAVEVDKDGGKFAELFRQYGSMLEVHLPANRYKDLIELRKRAFSGRFSSSSRPKKETLPVSSYVLPDEPEELDDLGYQEVTVQRIPKSASVKNRYSATMEENYDRQGYEEDASYYGEETPSGRVPKKGPRKASSKSRAPVRAATVKPGRILGVALALLLLLAGGVWGIPRVKSLFSGKKTPPPVVMKSETATAPTTTMPSALPTETMTGVPTYETASPETAVPVEGEDPSTAQQPGSTQTPSGESLAATNPASTGASKVASSNATKPATTKPASKPAQTSIVDPAPVDSGSSAVSAPADASYILPTHAKTITNDDVAGMSKAELQRAINEIYARHGYEFDRAGAPYRYFMEQPWYANLEKTTSAAVAEGRFSDLERKNLGFLVRYKDSLN